MAKTPPPSPPAFRAEAVEPARTRGKGIPQLAYELGVSEQALRGQFHPQLHARAQPTGGHIRRPEVGAFPVVDDRRLEVESLRPEQVGAVALVPAIKSEAGMGAESLHERGIAIPDGRSRARQDVEAHSRGQPSVEQLGQLVHGHAIPEGRGQHDAVAGAQDEIHQRCTQIAGQLLESPRRDGRQSHREGRAERWRRHRCWERGQRIAHPTSITSRLGQPCAGEQGWLAGREDPEVCERGQGIVKSSSSPAKRGGKVGNIPREAARIGGPIPGDRPIRAQRGEDFGGQNLT